MLATAALAVAALALVGAQMSPPYRRVCTTTEGSRRTTREQLVFPTPLGNACITLNPGRATMLELLTTPERVNQALQALVHRAQLHDRDAQRIGQLLLAMSDGSTYSVDLQDLAYLPPQIMDNVRHLINFHLATGLPLKGLIGQEELQPLIKQWGIPQAALA